MELLEPVAQHRPDRTEVRSQVPAAAHEPERDDGRRDAEGDLRDDDPGDPDVKDEDDDDAGRARRERPADPDDRVRDRAELEPQEIEGERADDVHREPEEVERERRCVALLPEEGARDGLHDEEPLERDCDRDAPRRHGRRADDPGRSRGALLATVEEEDRRVEAREREERHERRDRRQEVEGAEVRRDEDPREDRREEQADHPRQPAAHPVDEGVAPELTGPGAGRRKDASRSNAESLHRDQPIKADGGGAAARSVRGVEVGTARV